MTYLVEVNYPDTTRVFNERDTEKEALIDAENAIPSGFRPEEYEKIGYDVHVFRNDQAADNLRSKGSLSLRCPNGTFISITKM